MDCFFEIDIFESVAPDGPDLEPCPSPPWGSLLDQHLSSYLVPWQPSQLIPGIHGQPKANSHFYKQRTSRWIPDYIHQKSQLNDQLNYS